MSYDNCQGTFQHAIGNNILFTVNSYCGTLYVWRTYRLLYSPDLTVVGSLRYLTYLDVSFNKLTTILDTINSSNLIVISKYFVLHVIMVCQQEANYSHNEIEVLGNFSHHKSLTTLKVACILKPLDVSACSIDLTLFKANQITEISGLKNLIHLTHLDLSNNRIESITNLDCLPLKQLNLVCITLLRKYEPSQRP